MKIKLGNYTITNDGMQFILKETQLIKNPKKPELGLQTKEVVIGYFGKMEHLLKKMMNYELLKSESTNVSELLDRINDIKMMIDLNIKEINKKASK